MRHLLYIFMLIAAMAICYGNAAGQQTASPPQWEQNSTIPADAKASEAVGDGALVRVHGMHIYVELEQPAAVKLFTILGQPVSSMQLPAGVSRLRLSARGIYILKIGSSTRRITI